MGSFTGPFGTQGGGWNSDRFCTASGTLTGELVAPDRGVARARLEEISRTGPARQCFPRARSSQAGDGVWIGTATSDDIRLQISDVLRCPVNVDGRPGTGMPMADFERTVSLDLPALVDREPDAPLAFEAPVLFACIARESGREASVR